MLPDTEHFAAARQLVRQYGGPTQLQVWHRGELVVDERIGVGAEALFWPYSTSKLWVATAIWALHDDGKLDVDAPVATYWPAFAAAGKSTITIREVLQHRSGLPRVGGSLHEVRTMTNWHRACRNIATATAANDRLAAPAYEWLAWGFILAKVVAGASGQRFEDALRNRIMRPLGADSHAVLPADAVWRGVPFRGTEPSTRLVAAVLNRRSVREACIPAGGIWSRATDLATLLETLAKYPERLRMRPETVRAMLTPSNNGEFDRYSGSRVWWGNGVQLGHSAPSLMGASALGRRSTARTFGHNGSNVSMAWHDLDRDCTFVHCSGRILPFPLNRRYLMRVADAVTAAIDATTP